MGSPAISRRTLRGRRLEPSRAGITPRMCPRSEDKNGSPYESVSRDCPVYCPGCTGGASTFTVLPDGDCMALETIISPNLDSTLRENRVFPPPEEFAKRAHIKSMAEYEQMYQRSVT